MGWFSFALVLSFLLWGSIHSPDVQERCTMLIETDQQMDKEKKPSKEDRSEDNISLDQSLSAALDSFDNLFCRRCLVCGLDL